MEKNIQKNARPHTPKPGLSMKLSDEPKFVVNFCIVGKFFWLDGPKNQSWPG